MTNNDILRRLRYVFDFDDSAMISLFALDGHEVSRAEVSDWLKKEDDPLFHMCGDALLAGFLDGVINDMRGKKEGEPEAEPVKFEGRLTNNMILRKLIIALNLKADDTLKILSSVNFIISKHELSAFFRKVGHKHYRECKNQILRNFLNGLQLKYRDITELKQVFDDAEIAAEAEAEVKNESRDSKDVSDVWAR
jgi:uncharacterized protein YehS (DUF1456 family)|tara:strand:- start:1457 stop:2038 length:582 start_codon:yes stop_codon:yes gene_type:complete